MVQRLTALFKRISESEYLLALLVTLVLICVGLGLGYENNKIVPVNPASSAHYNSEPNNRLSLLSNWDGPIYLSIAQHGYTSKIQANFFPLYPLLTRIVHTVIPSVLISGLLVSWAALSGAIYFFIKILKKLYKLEDNLEALRGTLFFVLFPTGVFLLATYTESLFAFLSLGAIYFALNNRYLASALFAAFLTATHVNGLFVVAFIALILLGQKLNLVKVITTAVIGCGGFIAYLIYQEYKFHSPFAFLHAQKLHNWVNPTVSHLISEVLTLNGFFLLLVLISAIYWWKRRISFSIYSIFYLLIVFIGGKDFGGFGRYALMAFPLEIMLYEYFRKKKLGYSLVLAFSSILWAFILLRYMGGYTGG